MHWVGLDKRVGFSKGLGLGLGLELGLWIQKLPLQVSLLLKNGLLFKNLQTLRRWLWRWIVGWVYYIFPTNSVEIISTILLFMNNTSWLQFRQVSIWNELSFQYKNHKTHQRTDKFIINMCYFHSNSLSSSLFPNTFLYSRAG